VIGLLGIVVGIVGAGFNLVATLRKINRTAAFTTWGSERYRYTSAEVRLVLIGWALLLVGMALIWTANRLHW
jgi:hypothetical protein